MRVRVEIPDLQQVLYQSQLKVDKLREELGPATKEAADLIRADARSRIRNVTGELSKGIISQVTWAHNTSKAFAGVGMDKKMNDKFVVYTKYGVRYYMPSAVEYGHRSPGAAMSIELTNKRTYRSRAHNKWYTKRKKSKKGTKAHSFMRKAYKVRKNEAVEIIENRIRRVLEG